MRPTAGFQAPGSATSMPGWHIFADLTPPELMIARRTRSLRIWVAIALSLVVAGVGAGYDQARGEANDGAAAVIAAQDAGQVLRTQQQQFAGVTTLQATVDRAHQQLATLMASDVDVDALISKIWTALPPGMTITQVTVAIPEQNSGQAPEAAGSGGAASLDTSDATHIGTVTMAGSGTTIDDVPALIDKLSAIKGVYSPFPTSNQIAQSDSGTGSASASGTTSYSLQFTLTNTLFTNRYAAEGEN